MVCCGGDVLRLSLIADADRATCPAGVTRPVTPRGPASSAPPVPAAPLRDRCTTAKEGRSFHVHPHDARQRAHRRRAADPGWQADYRRYRPMVERSIAWLTARGNRRLRYRGIDKNNAWLHHRTAALNLRRLLNLGLNHRDGAWAIA